MTDESIKDMLSSVCKHREVGCNGTPYCMHRAYDTVRECKYQCMTDIYFDEQYWECNE